MTPEETEHLNRKFALITAHIAYNKELLHELTMAVLCRTSDDGDQNCDLAFAAFEKAGIEFNAAYESYGKSGAEMSEILKRTFALKAKIH